MIMITGRIHDTRWTDQNGTERYGSEIIAEQVDFLAKAKEAAPAETTTKRRSKQRRHPLTSWLKAQDRDSRSGAFAHSW
jgi:single-stranded DNA-binding protein